MDTEQRKAQVTELFVRMDCNGCVQRIKRALHNLDGIYEVYIDVAHQKLTVVGRVEPEKIVKAIKKTRKIATICTPAEASTEPSSSETTPAEQAANSNAPSTESTNQAPIEATPPLDPPKETPPAENEGPDVKPVPESNEASTSKPKSVGEIHMVHHYPHNDNYREQWNTHPRAYEIRHEASPHYLIHSYNNYRPSHSISEYLYNREAPQRSEGNDYYHNQHSRDGSHITSMFSEENPNACTIA
ncbi:hypothetical protein IEQ34_010425 [Dendrobium chrysotoxum]|uniref:HMA domain-containing protein n=1 Tax=Dendrobium chrysotoxum TaxID=161865 RepID=A0AAV7H3T5_DENCH|nr:hypothetical protein IEQ34_010425 [Dendrobium chrysotoxum]